MSRELKPAPILKYGRHLDLECYTNQYAVDSKVVVRHYKRVFFAILI